MEKNWMTKLARHYNRHRSRNKDHTEIIVLFDIDGTILDHRRVIYDVLNSYDQKNDTQHFHSLELDDIDVHENSIDSLLTDFNLQPELREDIREFYREERWSDNILLDSHRPFEGVMDVIRWFQLQPRTHVGLNTARPESLRETTLKSLNRLGKKYKVTFRDSLLHMNQNGWSNAEKSKVKGIEYFQDSGYHILAMIDNEPENLSAIDRARTSDEILLLHADKILDARSDSLPEGSVSGQNYRISDLIQGQAEPERIKFIRNGLKNTRTLQDFINSPIQWGNLVVRRHPQSGDFVLRKSSFSQKPPNDSIKRLSLESGLIVLQNTGKSLVYDLNFDGDHLREFIQILRDYVNELDHFGFKINLSHLDRSHVIELVDEFPSADYQLSINCLSDAILAEPDRLRVVLNQLQESWDIDEVSLDWQVFKKRNLLEKLKEWGFNANIGNVPNLEQFLQSAFWSPDSLTIDLTNKNYPIPPSQGPHKVI